MPIECKLVKLGLNLDMSGMVQPCNVATNESICKKENGSNYNLLNDDIKEIWHSKSRQKIIEDHKNDIRTPLCKPFVGVSASGCHTNISLWKGGKDELIPCGNKTIPGMENVFHHRRGGTNVFMPDGKDRRILSIKQCSDRIYHLHGRKIISDEIRRNN